MRNTQDTTKSKWTSDHGDSRTFLYDMNLECFPILIHGSFESYLEIRNKSLTWDNTGGQGFFRSPLLWLYVWD